MNDTITRFTSVAVCTVSKIASAASFLLFFFAALHDFAHRRLSFLLEAHGKFKTTVQALRMVFSPRKSGLDWVVNQRSTFGVAHAQSSAGGGRKLPRVEVWWCAVTDAPKSRCLRRCHVVGKVFPCWGFLKIDHWLWWHPTIIGQRIK